MDVEPFDDFVDCLEVDLVEGDSDGEIETEIEGLKLWTKAFCRGRQPYFKRSA